MSAPRTSFVLRQRSDVELRELAVRLLQEYGSEVFGLTALFGLPLLTPLVLLPKESAWLVGFACWLMLPLLELPALLILSRRVFGVEQTRKETLVMVAQGLRPALWLRSWSAPLVALCNILPLMGGLFFSVRFPFLSEVTVLEHATAKEARTRSRALTNFVNIPPATTALFTYMVVASVSDLGLRAGLGYVMSVHLGPAFLNGGSPQLFLLGLLFAAPMVSAHRYLSYVQARMTAEGWDLRLDFETLASLMSERRTP